MTEHEKMLSGKLYDPSDAELTTLRVNAHKLCRKYNNTDEDDKSRPEILSKLLGTDKLPENIYIQGPIQFDYGVNTKIGKNFYANFNLTVLDCGNVFIGDNVFMGPSVSIYSPCHPLVAEERRYYLNDRGVMTDREYSKEIKIGSDVWIGGGVKICAGAEIGNGCVIGAGSVVTGKIPDGYLAYGVPCKPVRKITKDDKLLNK